MAKCDITLSESGKKNGPIECDRLPATDGRNGQLACQGMDWSVAIHWGGNLQEREGEREGIHLWGGQELLRL